jgi:hypothetical protein
MHFGSRLRTAVQVWEHWETGTVTQIFDRDQTQAVTNRIVGT